MSAVGASAWTASRERSNRLALRTIAWIAVHLGRRVARWVLHPIALYFVCFAPSARRHSRRYLTRALGRPAGWRDIYRHVHAFAAVALDRIWFVRGELDSLSLQHHGGELIDENLANGTGALLLGAHLGSFAALHAISEQRPGLRVAMAMYPDNARMIHAVLQAIAPHFKLPIIAIGRSGSTLAIRDWVAAGGFCGMLGDRWLGTATARATGGTVERPFLGTPATFPDGPMRLAMVLRQRVFFMVALYRGGNRYDLRFEVLADFRELPADPAARERCLQSALSAYVERLEALCREAPYNWFNFYDFWREDTA